MTKEEEKKEIEEAEELEARREEVERQTMLNP